MPIRSGAVIGVVIAHDVVFAEIVAELHLDHLDETVMVVFKPMPRALRNIDGWRAGEGHDLVADGHGGGAGDDRPMLTPVLVALQRQAAARRHDDALHLETLALVEHMERAPRAIFTIHH